MIKIRNAQIMTAQMIITTMKRFTTWKRKQLIPSNKKNVNVYPTNIDITIIIAVVTIAAYNEILM